MPIKCVDGCGSGVFLGWGTIEAVCCNGTILCCPHPHPGQLPMPHDGIGHSQNSGVGSGGVAHPRPYVRLSTLALTSHLKTTFSDNGWHRWLTKVSSMAWSAYQRDWTWQRGWMLQWKRWGGSAKRWEMHGIKRPTHGLSKELTINDYKKIKDITLTIIINFIFGIDICLRSTPLCLIHLLLISVNVGIVNCTLALVCHGNEGVNCRQAASLISVEHVGFSSVTVCCISTINPSELGKCHIKLCCLCHPVGREESNMTAINAISYPNCSNGHLLPPFNQHLHLLQAHPNVLLQNLTTVDVVIAWVAQTSHLSANYFNHTGIWVICHLAGLMCVCGCAGEDLHTH